MNPGSLILKAMSTSLTANRIELSTQVVVPALRDFYCRDNTDCNTVFGCCLRGSLKCCSQGEVSREEYKIWSSPPISLHTKEKKGKKNKSIIMALCCGSVKIFTPVQPALPGKHSTPSDFID